MRGRDLLVFAVLVVAFALAGCSKSPAAAPDVRTATEATTTSQVSTAPAVPRGVTTDLQPGLYDLSDGTVQAVGTYEHRDVEGGYWAIVGDAASVVAVIANGDEFAKLVGSLEGHTVIVTGTKLDGASAHEASPQIEATAITQVTIVPKTAE